jgi:hypothetical protein
MPLPPPQPISQFTDSDENDFSEDDFSEDASDAGLRDDNRPESISEDDSDE